MQNQWNGHAVDISMMLGRLIERSDAVILRLNGIDSRLLDGEKRMTELSDSIKEMKRRPKETIETISALEKLVKSSAAWLIPLLVAWATGSLEAGLKAAGLFK